MITTRNSESPDNKSIRELRDELKDLNGTFKQAIKSNEKLSLGVVALAFVQITIMLFQVFFDIQKANGVIVGVIILAILGVFIVYIIKEFTKEDKK